MRAKPIKERGGEAADLRAKYKRRLQSGRESAPSAHPSGRPKWL